MNFILVADGLYGELMPDFGDMITQIVTDDNLKGKDGIVVYGDIQMKEGKKEAVVSGVLLLRWTHREAKKCTIEIYNKSDEICIGLVV